MIMNPHKASRIDTWNLGDLEPATACLACGGNNTLRQHVGLTDMLAGLPGSWNFLSCRSCGSLTLDPRPTPMAIAKAYPEGYVTHRAGAEAHERDNGSGLLWRLANGYLNARFGCKRAPADASGRALIPLAFPVRQQLDYFYRHLPKGGSGTLLDVGCGNGAFLIRARSAGWIARGIEPDPEAAQAAQSAGVDVSNCTIDAFSANAEFDHITLSHVFEHLHSPASALQRVRGWLKPGGLLWMALPNPGGIGHKVYRENWFALDPPRHLMLPSQRELRAMLGRAGYEDIRFLRRGRGSRSSILPSEMYARKRGRGIRHGGNSLSVLVDLLASLYPRFAEETVVVAKSPEA